MLRAIIGLIAGIVAAFAAVVASQAVVNLIYPLPRGLNVFDRAEVERVFQAMPASHFGLILLTYFLGGLIGALVALRVGRAYWPLWTTVVLIAASAALNVFTYPHPVWAQVGAILLPFVGGVLAQWLLGPPPPPAVEAESVDGGSDLANEGL